MYPRHVYYHLDMEIISWEEKVPVDHNHCTPRRTADHRDDLDLALLALFLVLVVVWTTTATTTTTTTAAAEEEEEARKKKKGGRRGRGRTRRGTVRDGCYSSSSPPQSSS